MNTVSIKGILKQTQEGFVIVPVTKADKQNLAIFADTAENKYLSIVLKTSNGTKTYEQCKTVWALISIIFESMNGRKPSERERKELYSDLLDEYADNRPSILHPERTVPLGLSEMSKQQASKFIQSLINVLSEACDLTEAQQISVKDIFTEWQSNLALEEKDWTDYDKDGNLLTVEQWRATHTVSFASGIGGDLELAHIVSKGSDEIHRECVWNALMLTHAEHMKQHEIGWNAFLEIYPHLKGRVNKAREIAGKLALLED